MKKLRERSGILRLWLAAATATVLVVFEGGKSQALDFRDIAGTWCSEGDRVRFEETTAAIVRADGARRENRVVYKFTPTQVVVQWPSGSETTYGEVAGEQRTEIHGFTLVAFKTMVEQAGMKADGTWGPDRRNWHRCSAVSAPSQEAQPAGSTPDCAAYRRVEKDVRQISPGQIMGDCIAAKSAVERVNLALRLAHPKCLPNPERQLAALKQLASGVSRLAEAACNPPSRSK